MEPTRPALVWIVCDTRLGLAGRLISRPLGAQGEFRKAGSKRCSSRMIFACQLCRAGLGRPVIVLYGRVGARGLCPRAHLHKLSFRPVLELPVRDTPAGLRQRLPSLPNMLIPKHSIWRLTTRWSRPGQPEVAFSAILGLAGRGGSSRGR